MATLKDIFATTPSLKVSRKGSKAQEPADDALGGSRGPQTQPVKMNLEERMTFRRELLYEAIRASLNDCLIPVNSYRFKVIRTDRRGHCFVVMIDMSPTFLISPSGHHDSLKETAAVLIQNAEAKYGLQVSGVYWRSDDSLDASIAHWARPAASTPSTDVVSHDSIDLNESEAVSVEEMVAFEAARQKNSAIHIGDRSYFSDLTPLLDEPRRN